MVTPVYRLGRAWAAHAGHIDLVAGRAGCSNLTWMAQSAGAGPVQCAYTSGLTLARSKPSWPADRFHRQVQQTTATCRCRRQERVHCSRVSPPHSFFETLPCMWQQPESTGYAVNFLLGLGKFQGGPDYDIAAREPRFRAYQTAYQTGVPASKDLGLYN